ncbi:alpha/beta hydrolase [Cedecea neteri]|uniref:alpha/beta fold hydrolase n=1 Tax=Cedecea neteri TaxID=158822 RepID=UPI002AA7F9FA|nr:alpha/beta hydrolase [Cedecea neteri]WPU22006.1 alpha/beta hydrolase [Cedecea neteri]
MSTATNLPVSLYFDAFGEKTHPAIVLLPGLGSQSISWSQGFCQRLADAGFFILRVDNRDCGLSPMMNHAGVPNLQALSQGQSIPIAYTLRDMAADVALTLDNAGIPAAHIVGRSMGGMIAQLFAARYPQKTRSLCAIMSSTGNPQLPPPAPDVMAMLIGPKPDPHSHQSAWLEQQLAFFRRIASTHIPFDEQYYTALLTTSLARASSMPGMLRQIAAMAATGDLRLETNRIAAPTLVIHGTRDPLFPVEAGQDIARTIPAAKLQLIEGMGHEIPPALEEEVASLLLAHFAIGK